jgi:methanogenic corrinoid protein MtbC1
MGEAPDYDDLVITHGICGPCAPKAYAFSDSDFQLATLLRTIQDQLYEAGTAGDLAAAGRIIDEASRAGVRGVDVLIGTIAPLLYQIGEDWKRGTLSVADEHRFTNFCERLIELISARIRLAAPVNTPPAETAEVLLVNAPGNRHTLAIRILALWLSDQGLTTRVVDGLRGEELVVLICRIRPRLLLLSMALAEHLPEVAAIAARVASLPTDMRPRVIVGGNAVKRGLIDAIPGAELMADICSL